MLDVRITIASRTGAARRFITGLSLGLLGACASEPPSLPGIDDAADVGESSGDTGDDLDDDSSDGHAPDPDDGPDVPVPFTEACQDAAAMQASAGCEFWAVDLPNAAAGAPTAPDDQPFAVAVTNRWSGAAARVEVFVGTDLDPIASVELPMDSAHIFQLPSMHIPHDATGPGELAYRVASDVPILAFQFNPLRGDASPSSDASALLPTHRLGVQYSAVTGHGLWTAESFSFGGAFVSVVATEDDTVIDVYPTWHNVAPGEQVGVRLDRGEVFTTLSRSDNPFPQFPSAQGELSGTRVVSNRPVAVFSGNVHTREPIGNSCCADHLEEQLPPIGAWGTAYAAPPPPTPGGVGNNPAGYRIVGAVDGTALTYWPEAPEGAPTTIDADEVVRFQTDLPFWVTSDAPDQPFSVTQFLLSHEAVDASDSRGDPAMLTLPPRSGFETMHVVFVPGGYDVDYVTIVRDAASEVELDKLSVEGADWRLLGTLDAIEYQFAAIELGVGSHVITCDTPCAVLSVGYGDAVSYGYVTGLAGGVPGTAEG